MTDRVTFADDLLSALPAHGDALVVFVPVGSIATASDALTASIGEVQHEIEDEVDRSEDDNPPLAGEWEWMVLDAQIVVVARKSSVAAELPRIAQAMARRGASGRFEQWHGPAALPPPLIRAPAIVGHLRAGGSTDRLVDLALGWCRARAPASAWVNLQLVGWVNPGSWPDAETRVRSELDAKRDVSVAVGEADDLRAVSVTANRVNVLASASDVDQPHQAAALVEEMISLFRTAAGEVVEATLFRTHRPTEALTGRQGPDQDLAVIARLLPADVDSESWAGWCSEQQGTFTLLTRSDLTSTLDAAPPVTPKRRSPVARPTRIDWSS